jgi:hypothetical protein
MAAGEKKPGPRGKGEAPVFKGAAPTKITDENMMATRPPCTHAWEGWQVAIDAKLSSQSVGGYFSHFAKIR